MGQNVIGDDALGAIMTILEGMDEWSDILGEAAAILDMLDQLLLQMAENMPPWLIQEILAIKGMIANPPDGANIDELMARLKELEGERKVWERLYWEIIIDGYKNLDSIYIQNSESIISAYQNATQFMPGANESNPPMSYTNDKPLPANIASMSATLNMQQLSETFPDLKTRYENFNLARQQYSTLKILNKIEDELDISTVEVLIDQIKIIGLDIIDEIGKEFKARNFDKDLITNDPTLELKVIDILLTSITKIYSKL